MNGAGPIHDWEFALIGATTESVARYIRSGEFGLWHETGHMNDVVRAGASQGAPAPTAGNAAAVGAAQPASDGGGTPPFAPVQMSFAEGAFRVDNTSKETLKGFSDRLIQAVEAINVGPGQIHVNPTPVTVKPNITVEPSPVEVRERPPLHVRLTGVERDKQGRITGADFKASEDSSPPASKG